MFRKSVSFFILIALFWILLWVYIPDGSPNNFTIGDFFRGLPLLFSFMAFGFALLMLIIRYKGVDIVSNLFPQAGITMWVAKHAYQFSQPKTIVHCLAEAGLNDCKLQIKTKQNQHELILNSTQAETLNLGYLRNNPTFNWINSSGQQKSEKLIVKPYLKKLGKNLDVDVLIKNDTLSFKVK